MKKLAAAAAILLLTGCASAPKQSLISPAKRHSVSTPAAKSAGTLPQETTPNQIVKKRWYERFKVHPKWFH